MIVTFVTSPVLTASAFAEQSIASRQPLPTPPGFQTPIVDDLPPVRTPPGFKSRIVYAFRPVPPDAPGVALQAPAMIAIAATATRPRANPIRFIEHHSSSCPDRGSRRGPVGPSSLVWMPHVAPSSTSLLADRTGNPARVLSIGVVEQCP